MKACALDYGTVRIGVAVADELGLYAHPRPVISARNTGRMLQAIEDLVREDEITHIVVGLPLDMKGGEGGSAMAARQFAGKVANATKLTIELWDERLSTAQANRSLKEHFSAKKSRARIDSAAACVILQSWLEARSNL